MKYQDLIKKMTLEEKAALMGGKGEWDSWNIDRVGIPSMIMSDGPSGLRRQAGAGDHLGLNESLPATCFPSAATMANSWDESLGEEVGAALGEEAKTMGVHILLGPGLNIKRSPLCGRNFEYFSEDPYLSGKMAASLVRGIQSQGVYSCIKHFAVNSQEERRMAMNAVVDERTLREIYLTGFEIAVKEGGARSIMTSYNELNGTYTNENTHLLTDILRNTWGYDGIVMTDWGGSNDHVAGIKAGSHLEMPAPGLDSARQVVAAVKNGTLPESVLDERVDEFLTAVFDTAEKAKGHPTEFDKKAHHALARRAAAQCAVLLKNENSILPLKPGVKVAVIGDFAFAPRYQGAGSSMVNKTQLDTIDEMIRDEKDITVVGSCRGYDRLGGRDDALKQEALDLAKKADVVLYFFGLNEISESEGLDRKVLNIPKNQIDLLRALKKVNPAIVGVLSGGAAIEMPWKKDLSAILHLYLSGQAGAGAALDVLTGRVNPSGKLNETFPEKLSDTPCYAYYPAKERNSDYREGIFVGYRYYETSDTAVAYPFGFGLSYTTFAYSDLAVTDKGVSFTITNTGKCDGAEIAQLYVGLPGAQVFRPVRELKGFKKVFIPAGGSVKVEIPFDDKTFRYWNVKTNDWAVEGGTYTISIGASSEDIRLTGSLAVAGDAAPLPYDKEKTALYESADIQDVPDEAFAELLGYPVPDGSWGRELTANDAICQLKNAKGLIGRIVFKYLDGNRIKAEKAGKPDLNTLFIYNMPFRAIAKMTGGAVSMDMADGIVEVVNGHFFKGIGKVVSGYFKNNSANKKYAALLGQKK